jgi:Fe-S oxidoreductase
MEQKELRSWEALCIQDEPARCRAGCPFNMDARAFVMAIAAGNVQSGRAILDKSIPLPQITGSICEAPCEQYCLRKELGGPIAIASLERTCLGSTLSRGKLLRLPPRPKKVVLIGGGPASLVVAYDLAKKGYPIELYHSALPGGWLHQLPIWQLPRERLNEELALLKKGGVNFHQVERLDIALLRELEQNHDAIFIECSEELQPELLAYVPKPDMTTMATSSAKIFSDGLSSSSGSYVLAASHGREAALSIDRFLQGASLTAARPPLRHGQTALYTNTASIGAAARVTPAAGPDYSMEEAHSEAGRCLDCQCLECVKNCVYLQKFGSYPRVYARQIYNNEAIVKGIHQANILINSCSLCNQCATLCPNDFSMAELCLQARQRMVTESRMPPSAHEFALSEMRAARGDREQLLGHAPGYSTSSALFFPGCQLSGVRPDQTFALHAYLRKTTPDTGIWLSCCGAPAHWAGRQQEFNEIMMDLTNKWQQLGRPKMIFACSSCLKIIRDNLPEIEAISVWNLIKAGDFALASASSPVALSDPCTSRQDTATQSTVRKLVQDLGQPLENLTASGELTECCGYGGLMEIGRAHV